MSRDSSVTAADGGPVVYARPAFPDAWDAVVLPVDKPAGMTSFDVIRVLRRLVGVRKMGHAGTLDPMATGLLFILVGRATKLMDRFMALPKTYTGTIRLGEETASYDAETDVVRRTDPSGVTPKALEAARSRFLGTIEQQTPVYSAVKMGGERLYRKARRGERVTPPPRVVTIDRFELRDRTPPDIRFEVQCSKGTYIRSLAHEFGQALAVGGHLVALRRTAVGPYRVESAWSLEAIRERLASAGGGA